MPQSSSTITRPESTNAEVTDMDDGHQQTQARPQPSSAVVVWVYRQKRRSLARTRPINIMHSDNRGREPVCLATTSVPVPWLSTYLSSRLRGELYITVLYRLIFYQTIHQILYWSSIQQLHTFFCPVTQPTYLRKVRISRQFLLGWLAS